MRISRQKLVLPGAVLSGACVFALLLLVTAPKVESMPPERQLLTVRVMHAKPASMRLTVRSQGTVAPRTESAVVPEVSGRVLWTSPALVSGGFFEVGELLLRIDPLDYEIRVTKTRAALARAEGELDHARQSRERLDGLAERDIASPSQLDDVRRNLRVAQATLDEAQANLTQARRDLARTEIRAPYSGRVRDERVDVGQFVSVGASIATIYATDYVEIRLPIPDSQLAYLELPLFRAGNALAEGPKVVLRARFAGADHSWTGRIVRTEGEIDTKSRMVHVVARVEDPYRMTGDSATGDAVVAPLAVGLFVRAEIAGSEVRNVVVVPREALRDGNSILLLDDEDRLRRRPVEVLRIDRDRVLVRDVPVGARICVSPLQVFVDGMRVRALEPTGGETRTEVNEARS
jgi:RND family efflux transporter MFP subunit